MESHEKLPPFLRKTWDIVEDASTDHIVRWSSSGRSFVVLDVESFAKEILPRFFKHSNWSSFVRQLNTYGFRKIDPDRWEFANENFSKGGKDQLNVIQRRKPSMPAPAPGARVAEGSGSAQHAPQPSTPAVAQPHTQPMAPGTEYMLAAPYPLDLRHTPGVPLFHPPGTTLPGLPTPVPNAAAAFNLSAMRVSADAQHMMSSAGNSAKPVPMQVVLPEAPELKHRLTEQQSASLASPPHQQQQPSQPQLPGQHIQSAQALAAIQSLEAARESGIAAVGMERVAALMEEYLRPGQRILAHIQQQPDGTPGATGAVSLLAPRPQDSHSTSTTSGGGPSASTENDEDTEETRKVIKRTRADMHRNTGQGSSSSGPETVAWYPQYATPYGHFAQSLAVESTLHGGPSSSAHLGKDGMPLPPGITRPKPQAVGITAQSLISEMAGQMGRLSALATEVHDLRTDNVKLRHGMDVLSARNHATQVAMVSDAVPMQARMAEQQDMMRQYKLKADEDHVGMQMQLSAHHHAQVVQQERSAVLEAQVAQQRKWAFDTAEVARTLEVQNVDLRSKLAQQENLNKAQHHSNQALEARVAELEQQLTGRQEMLIKGLEDRMMMAMNGLLATSMAKHTADAVQAVAAGITPTQATAAAMADAAALAETFMQTLTTAGSGSSTAASPSGGQPSASGGAPSGGNVSGCNPSTSASTPEVMQPERKSPGPGAC